MQISRYEKRDGNQGKAWVTVPFECQVRLFHLEGDPEATEPMPGLAGDDLRAVAGGTVQQTAQVIGFEGVTGLLFRLFLS